MLLHYVVKVKAPKKYNIRAEYYRRKCALSLLIWGVIQQSVHEKKIHDTDDLQKRLMQTCFDFDRNIIDAG